MATARRAILLKDTRAQALDRLSRIEGQVRGLKKMVEAGRYCPEVLAQVASVQEALRGFTKLMMRNYLEGCATEAIRSADRDGIYDELMDVIFKFAR
jgi:DNA-binding FrmR family transcriptional regulator